MLRFAVLVLLLANVAYYSWSNGLLAPWGFAPQVEREPERLTQQIAPESLQLVAPTGAAPEAHTAPPAQPAPPVAPLPPPAPAPSPSTAPPAAVQDAAPPAAVSTVAAPQRTTCLQAGPMKDARAAALRQALAALPSGSWSMEGSEVPGRWMVYMGPYTDEDVLAKKRMELRALKVAYDRPAQAFEPGLALGRFSTQEAAQRGLADLTAHGVRTARVIQERAAETRHLLRLPAATDALRAQIDSLAIAWGDTPLQPCGK